MKPIKVNDFGNPRMFQQNCLQLREKENFRNGKGVPCFGYIKNQFY